MFSKEDRIERAELRLADAEHELYTWGGHSGIRPSQVAYMEKKVRKAREKLDRLKND